MPQTLSTHRTRKREAMITRILDTARAIMREEGVAALSMQELARRLGIRAPSLYNYFSGKMDILDALFRLGFTLYGQHLARLLQGSRNFQEELRISIEGYLTFALENPELYQLCFERPVPGFTPSAESLQVSFGLLHRAYERVSAHMPEMNTPLDARQVTDLVIAITHGLTALHLANKPHLPAGEGRFGSLIPTVTQLLIDAWQKN